MTQESQTRKIVLKALAHDLKEYVLKTFQERLDAIAAAETELERCGDDLSSLQAKGLSHILDKASRSNRIDVTQLTFVNDAEAKLSDIDTRENHVQKIEE